MENLEKESVLVAAFERFVTQFVPNELSEDIERFGREIVVYFNPEVAKVKVVTDDYLMSSFTSAIAGTMFYILSVFLLRLLVKAVNPEPVPRKKGGYSSLIEKFTTEPLLLFGAIYNLLQVICCFYMTYHALLIKFEDDLSFSCNKHDLTSPKMARIHWLFYISKILDFFDTYMIILRRKWRQLSFLHCYHHASVFFLQWLFQRNAFDGDMWFVIFANTLVHVIMYFYYFLRTIDIEVPLILKKMITNIQLFQFTCMLGQGGYQIMNTCEYPIKMTVLYFCYIMTMVALFTNFFIANYLKKSKKKKKTN